VITLDPFCNILVSSCCHTSYQDIVLFINIISSDRMSSVLVGIHNMLVRCALHSSLAGVLGGIVEINPATLRCWQVSACFTVHCSQVVNDNTNVLSHFLVFNR
jgi:hypothetical protein